jgi:hypothetical protein
VTKIEGERDQAKCVQGCSQRHCIVATAAGESEEFLVLMVSSFCPLVLIVQLNLLFVEPCIAVQFIKKKIQQDARLYQNCIIPYLYEAQHVSGDTPPIIRSLKLHWQPLVLNAWKVVERVVGGRCQGQ